MVLTLGGAFGVALVTAVFAAQGHIGTPAGFVAGFRPALALASGLAALGAASTLAVGGRRATEPQAMPEASPAPSETATVAA